METYVRHIISYLKDQEDSMKDFLKVLVTLESPSSDKFAQDLIFDHLMDSFSLLDYQCFRFPGKKTGGFLTARPKSRDKNMPFQLIMGHCDTVWEKGTLSHMPIVDSSDKIRGPGIFDMKAGITQAVFAIRAIRSLRLPVTVMPYCLFNSDEEIGSRESTAVIRRLSRLAERVYVLEPPLGTDGRLKTARKGLGRFNLKVKGIAAHAGLDPGKGSSAILELSYQIQNLFALNDFKRGISVNVGMIDGGISPNVVAPESNAVIDVRTLTHEDAYEVTEKILSLTPRDPNVIIEVKGGFGRPPMEKTMRNQELWKSARKLGTMIGVDLKDATAGGGSDANTSSLYTATLDGLGTTGEGAHAAHEYIFKDKLTERTALLCLLLMLPSKKYDST